MDEEKEKAKEILEELEKTIVDAMSKFDSNALPTEYAAMYVCIMTLAKATLKAQPELFMKSYNRIYDEILKQPYTTLYDYKTFNGGSLN